MPFIGIAMKDKKDKLFKIGQRLTIAEIKQFERQKAKEQAEKEAKESK